MTEVEAKRQKAVVDSFLKFATDGMWGMWVFGMVFGIILFMPRHSHIVPWVWAIFGVMVIFISNMLYNVKIVLALRKIAMSGE